MVIGPTSYTIENDVMLSHKLDYNFDTYGKFLLLGKLTATKLYPTLRMDIMS